MLVCMVYLQIVDGIENLGIFLITLHRNNNTQGQTRQNQHEHEYMIQVSHSSPWSLQRVEDLRLCQLAPVVSSFLSVSDGMIVDMKKRAEGEKF